MRASFSEILEDCKSVIGKLLNLLMKMNFGILDSFLGFSKLFTESFCGLYTTKSFSNTFLSLFNSSDIHENITLPDNFKELIKSKEFIHYIYDPAVVLAGIFLLYLFFDYFLIHLKYVGIVNTYFCRNISNLLMLYEYCFDLLFPFYLAPALYFLSAFFNDPSFSVLTAFTSSNGCNHGVLIESKFFYISLQLLNLYIAGFMIYKFLNTRISKRFSHVWLMCRIFLFPMVLVPFYFIVHSLIYKILGLHPMLMFFKDATESTELYIAFGVLLYVIYIGFVFVVLPLNRILARIFSYLKYTIIKLITLIYTKTSNIPLTEIITKYCH